MLFSSSNVASYSHKCIYSFALALSYDDSGKEYHISPSSLSLPSSSSHHHHQNHHGTTGEEWGVTDGEKLHVFICTYLLCIWSYVCERSSNTVALSVSVLLSRQEEMRDDDMIWYVCVLFTLESCWRDFPSFSSGYSRSIIKYFFIRRMCEDWGNTKGLTILLKKNESESTI